MKTTLLSLWDSVNPGTFTIEYNETVYSVSQINQKIDRLCQNLVSETAVAGRLVYIDLKDRFLFFCTLMALLKLKADVVLVPVEMKPESYYNGEDLFITDNKKQERALFIHPSFEVTKGKEVHSPAAVKAGGSEGTPLLYFYTSSSTGKAKLIPKEAVHLLTEIYELKEFFTISPESLFFATAPLYHIYGFLFFFLLPLLTSSPMLLTEYFTPFSIAEVLEKRRPAFFVSIPTYYKIFADTGLIPRLPGNTVYLSSSAPLPPEVSRKFYENSLEITEIYGSTETGGIARRVSAKDPRWILFSYVSLMEVHEEDYVDKENRLQELRIDSKAISVPYDREAGYNTGDVAQISGTTFLLAGRNTRFAKIAGKRVDLEGVIAKYREYSSSLDREIPRDSLYAGEYKGRIFILSETGFPRKTAPMKQDLKKYLPEYAVPKIFIVSPIPKNAMGKINRGEIEKLVEKSIIQ